MSVTVIVVNWNSGEMLSVCLKKLTEQTVLPERILVVDNASSDNSAACVAHFQTVELLAMNSNLGFAAGNNRALDQCKTEFVVLLNPDAFPEPDWLECLLIAAKDHPEMAIFGSRQLCQEGSDILDGIGDAYHLSGLPWRIRHGAKQQVSDLVSGEIFSACAAAALYRREAILKVGGFDEDYFCYIEDVDLGFRLRLQGYKAMYVSNAVIYHVGSASTGGKESDFSVYHGYRNLFWTFVKNMPGFLFYLLLPLHLLAYFCMTVRFIIRGQGGVILRAERDAIKGFRLAFAKRKKIQAERVVKPQEIFRIMHKSLSIRKGISLTQSARLLFQMLRIHVRGRAG